MKKKRQRFPILIVLIVGVLIISASAWHFRDSLIKKEYFSDYQPERTGVIFHDRIRANNDDYLIFDYSAGAPPTCIISTYDGEKVFEFPWGDCLFTENGEMFHLRGRVSFFDKMGNRKWVSSNYNPHHSATYDRVKKEFFFLITETFQKNAPVDGIVAMNKEGKITFRWMASDHYAELIKILGRGLREGYDGNVANDVTHINSADILEENPLESRIPAFRRGNILVSCYLQSLMFVIDRETGAIVWSKVFSKNFHTGIHTVKLTDSGTILMFANRLVQDHDAGLRYSALREYDPLTDSYVWEYKGKPPFTFYADHWGAVHSVGKDQFLVTYSTTGYVFQIDRRGRILWEWHPPPRDEGKPTPVFNVRTVPRERVNQQIHVWKLNDPDV